MALAEVGAPIGLKGAVRLHTLKSVSGLDIDDSLLMQSDVCWVRLAQPGPTQWLHARILECSPQTRGLKLQLEGVTDRDQAERLRSAAVGLSRSSFPEPEAGASYWADLLGCEVINREGDCLGLVVSMQSNGEHDWLVLDLGMIPFVARYVDEVDPEAKRIRVDWLREWFA